MSGCGLYALSNFQDYKTLHSVLEKYLKNNKKSQKTSQGNYDQYLLSNKIIMKSLVCERPSSSFLKPDFSRIISDKFQIDKITIDCNVDHNTGISLKSQNLSCMNPKDEKMWKVVSSNPFFEFEGYVENQKQNGFGCYRHKNGGDF